MKKKYRKNDRTNVLAMPETNPKIFVREVEKGVEMSKTRVQNFFKKNNISYIKQR